MPNNIEESQLGSSASRRLYANSVVVKLKTTQANIRRLSAAAGLREAPASEVRKSFIEQLIDGGRVASALASAVVTATGARRARRLGLVSLELDRGTDAAALAAHLDGLGDEIEYAYVPAIKYPAARRSGGCPTGC